MNPPFASSLQRVSQKGSSSSVRCRYASPFAARIVSLVMGVPHQGQQGGPLREIRHDQMRAGLDEPRALVEVQPVAPDLVAGDANGRAVPLARLAQLDRPVTED